MKKINLIIAVLSVFAMNASIAQTNEIEWDENTTITQLSPEDSAAFELIILEKRLVEFANDETENLREYYSFHQRIRVNSSEAIENNNRFYLPVSGSVEVISLKGRTISPDGKIKTIGKENIIEAEEDGRKVQYFAFEGIEKGSEIEYIFQVSMNPRLTGNIFYLQSNLKKLKLEFELVYPDYLMFKSKSLNGFPELVKDSLDNDRVVMKAELTDVLPLEEEKYANYDPHRMGIIYKLYGNNSTGSYNIVNFNNVAGEMYNSLYSDYKKNKSALAKFTKVMEILPTDDGVVKISKIEKYIKNNFLIFPFEMILHKKLKTALKSPIGTEKDVMRIFVQMLRYLNIEHQVVVTCDRYDRRFDPDFEAFNFLQEYLIYFPEMKMYIAPTDQTSRMQFINYGCYDNYGLFIIPVLVGKEETGTAKIKYIEPVAEHLSTDSLILSCDLNADRDKLNIDYTRSVRGYNAKPYQSVWHLLEDEDKTEIQNDFPSFLTDNKDEILEVSVYNVEKDNFPVLPLKVQARLECEKFVEEVGDKFIIRVGELIGPQAELYLDKDRRMEVENPFNHSFHRTISFTIPEGYIVEGLEKLSINVVKEIDGKESMGFISSYKVEDNKVIITCDEYYRESILPATDFEAFREVINAAADFNKITLFVEKAG